MRPLKSLQTLLRPRRGWFAKTAAAEDLQQLRQAPDERLRFLAGVLSDAVDARLSVEEQQWIARIEELRGRLLRSSEPLELTDFGAGPRGTTRTEEEMRRGVAVERTVAQSCRASKPQPWATLLFLLVRRLRPESLLELGTCLGISAAYQAAALELNGAGRLVTLEGAPAAAALARANLQTLALERAEVIVGRFDETLPTVLPRIGQIDYAFIDGHHDEQATIAYFRTLLPRLKPGALVVFDDIAWSPGMAQAWSTIAHDTAVRAAIDLGPLGLCITSPQGAGGALYSVRLPF